VTICNQSAIDSLVFIYHWNHSLVA